MKTLLALTNLTVKNTTFNKFSKNVDPCAGVDKMTLTEGFYHDNKKGDSICAINLQTDTIHIFLGVGYKVEAYDSNYNLKETSLQAFASTYPINKITFTTDRADLYYRSSALKPLPSQLSYNTYFVLSNKWESDIKTTANSPFDLVIVCSDSHLLIKTSGKVNYYLGDTDFGPSTDILDGSSSVNYIMLYANSESGETSLHVSVESNIFSDCLPEKVIINPQPNQLFINENMQQDPCDGVETFTSGK